MVKKWLVVLIVGGASCLAVWTFASQRNKSSSNPSVGVKSIKTLRTDIGLEVSYSFPLEVGNLTEIDKNDHFIARLSSAKPAMLVSIRYEDGLSTAAALSKQEVKSLIITNLNLTYPKRFSGFKLISQKETTISSGQEAIDIEFEYTGPSGVAVRQLQRIIIASADRAIYISTQISVSDETTSKQILTNLINSAIINN